MKEVIGDLWDFHAKGDWIVIPTNCVVRTDGRAVMGAGVAKKAASKFPYLPKLLGLHISLYGSKPFIFWEYGLICLPSKYNFSEIADMGLLEEGARNLPLIRQLILEKTTLDTIPIYLPRLGTGLGRRKWDLVKIMLAAYLDDDFVVVNLPVYTDDPED